MILDLVWVTGEVLSMAALLYGAYLALTATESFQTLFARLKGVVAARLAKNGRPTGGRVGCQQDFPTLSNRA